MRKLLKLPANQFATFSLFLFSFLFMVDGVLHLLVPEFYLTFLPPGFAINLILLFGVLELLGGFGLLVPATRKWAGQGLMYLVMLLFIVNGNLAMEPDKYDWLPPRWILFTRPILQFVLIWWIYWVVKEVSP